MSIRKVPVDLGREQPDFRPRTPGNRSRNILRVGEVELRLEPRPRADQAFPPSFVKLAKRAVRLAERLPALRLGLGIHQIGQPLDLGQVHPPTVEGPAGELPRLGRTEPFELRQRLQSRRHNGSPAMHMEFGHVLAGERVRRREEQDETVIDEIAIGRVNGAQAGPAWFRQRIDQSFRVRIELEDPDMRMTAMPAGTPPVAGAKMVSARIPPFKPV